MNMSSAPLAGLAFALWTLTILLCGIGLSRWSKILTGTAKLGDFPGDQPHGSERYRRIVRAHANCLEILPIFIIIIVTAQQAGPMPDWFDGLCWFVVASRIAQSSVHIYSGSERAIAFRFSFLVMQVFAFLAMAILIFSKWP